MSAQRFQQVRGELQSLLDDLDTKVRLTLPASTGEALRRVESDIAAGLERAEQLVSRLDEAKNAAEPRARVDLIDQVRSYRRQVEALRRQAAAGRTNSAFSEHTALVGAQPSPPPGSAGDDPTRRLLLTGRDSLQRTTESLARTHRIAAETDDIGVGVMDELGQQRETLVRARDRLDETDAALSKSRRILLMINRRILTNKAILIVIILVELGILAGVVYFKFFR